MTSRVCLNFNRTWDEVGNIVTSTGSDGKPNGWVKEAFKGGVADKVLLRAGTRLYKFNNFPTLIDTNWLNSQGITMHHGVTISPWWSPFESFTHTWTKESGRSGSSTNDPGWYAKVKMAQHFGVSIREYGRITSAVKENWNSLKWLMIITLKHDAFGWFGGFTQMNRIDAGQATKRFGNEGAQSGGQKFTSAGMKDRIAKHGSKGTLAGGGTQFYIPNIKMMNVSAWNVDDLSAL